MPRSGLPPRLGTFAEFEDLVERGAAAGFFPEYVRYGLDAELVDRCTTGRDRAREAIRELVRLAAPAAERLGCETELAEVERVLDRGSGADDQRRAGREGGSLLSVAHWLADETVRGLR